MKRMYFTYKQLQQRFLKLHRKKELPFPDFPTLNVTGFSVAGCYAGELKSCNGKLSREHYISHGILKLFPEIAKSGIPWLAHREGFVGAESLVVKCLCQTHNSFLSPLDFYAVQIFETFEAFLLYESAMHTVVSGNLLQKWILKTLIGLICTGKFENAQKRFDISDVPKDWVEILFGAKAWPHDLGVYVFFEPGQRIQVQRGLSVAPLYLNGAVQGLSSEFLGLQLILSMAPRNESFIENVRTKKGLIFQPKELKNGDGKTIEIEWRSS